MTTSAAYNEKNFNALLEKLTDTIVQRDTAIAIADELDSCIESQESWLGGKQAHEQLKKLKLEIISK
jgi:hypothetical protein